MASESDQWYWAAMEPELSPKEKQLRDLFVNEYLVDYDIVKAAQRCGFQHAFAKDYGHKFYNESYVQQQIKAREHAQIKNPAELEKYNKERVIATLIEVATSSASPAAARVAAASKLASIYGMDKPQDPEDEEMEGVRGGVLLVPAIADINDWEAVAKVSQAKLIADVRN